MEIELTLTDRQFALLERAGASHQPAWTASELISSIAPSTLVLPAATALPQENGGGLSTDSVVGGSALSVSQGELACITLPAGESVRIEQVSGRQCVDVLAWGSPGDGECFSASATRMRHGVSPTVGDRLWSGWPFERALLELVEDTAPGHDLLHPACAPAEYEMVGAAPAPSCAALHALGIEALGFDRRALHDPFNLWFRPTLGDDGTLGWSPTAAGPGDAVTLRALVDTVLLVNPCVDDVFGCSCAPGGLISIATTGGARPDVVGAPVETRTVQIAVGPELTEVLGGHATSASREAVLRRAAVEHALSLVRASLETGHLP